MSEVIPAGIVGKFMPLTEDMCALHLKSQLCTACLFALYVCSKV